MTGPCALGEFEQASTLLWVSSPPSAKWAMPVSQLKPTTCHFLESFCIQILLLLSFTLINSLFNIRKLVVLA